MIKIGIVGSRRRDSANDLKLLYDKLQKIIEEYNVEEFIIVSGGCAKGGDRFAEIIAKDLNVPIIIHYPDKSALPENPKRWDFAKINYARNTLIAQDSDVLFAVVADDRTGGTEDTIKKYLKLKKTYLFLV